MGSCIPCKAINVPIGIPSLEHTTGIMLRWLRDQLLTSWQGCRDNLSVNNNNNFIRDFYEKNKRKNKTKDLMKKLKKLPVIVKIYLYYMQREYR